MNNLFTYPSDSEHSAGVGSASSSTTTTATTTTTARDGAFHARPDSNLSMASSSNATSTQSNIPISPMTFYNNSIAIRHEIHRFESVHPSIYAIYDLLDMIGGTDGQLIAQRIREHVVCIEDSFVNSQEWTLSRTVPDLRLGVVGTIHSGKSALVHRYLTGTYLQDESPEGGRFKKEVNIDGQSYLLLIRDEGGPPEMQFSCWADAVLFVYNTENESSFNEIYHYYNKMFHLRSSHDIPIFLIGTTDAISPSTANTVVDQARAKKLAMELKNCIALDANPVLGMNVDNVFMQACQQMITHKHNIENSYSSRPTTPKSPYRPSMMAPLSNVTNNRYINKPQSPLTVMMNPVESFKQEDDSTRHPSTNLNATLMSTPPPPPQHKTAPIVGSAFSTPTSSRPFLANKPKNLMLNSASPVTTTTLEAIASAQAATAAPAPAPAVPKRTESMRHSLEGQFKVPLPPTPVMNQETPEREESSSRKNRRKSNLFTPLSAYMKEKNAANEDKHKNGEVGVGRAIPIKQGYLYKKSKKALNKDWRKKYVTLTMNGCLTYHSSLHDYMNNVHGKNIRLKHTTVKIPGGKPRVGRPSISSASPSVLDSAEKMIPSTNPKYDNSKKRNRKFKNVVGAKNDNGDESDANEFVIVSLDNKQWLFNASTSEEREGWMTAIEQQILSSLQNTECDKAKVHSVNGVDDQTIHSIRTVPGNSCCVDCGAKDPDWASLNLGTLICIDCSGIHRKIGTHISKVRSLTLDVWPSSHVSVMLGLGNTAANKIWEANVKNISKPTASSGHEEKECFIRAKYETKQFLAPLTISVGLQTPLDTQIIDAVIKMDIKLLAHLLAHLSVQGLNLNSVASPNDKKTPLHFAARRGCLEITQLLLWYNASEKAVDADGKTALFYARINGHREIEELLIQSGCTQTSITTTDDNNSGNSRSVNSNGIISGSVPMGLSSDVTDSNSSGGAGRSLGNSSSSTTGNNRRESLQFHMKSMDQFNKLPASII